MNGSTPGPWRAVAGRLRPDAPAFGFSIEAVGKVPPIASAGVATPNHAHVTPGIATGFEAAEMEANARLIAAAPDLLKAARKVLAGLNARIDAAPLSAVPVFDGIAELHAAIAKAEGGTT